MKTFKAVFDENKTEGVFGISLVENPAMEGNFIALSKEQKIQFKTLNEEKRILIGLVLEPNKPIYRNVDGNEFNIVFDADTIRDLSYNFFKANHHKNSTIEHESPIEGVTFVESWIVEDPEKDKSAIYGFSYPKGSWVATMKVDSDQVWNDYVKAGKVLGFSVDAMIILDEVKLNKQMEVKEQKTFLSQLKEALGIKDEPKEAVAEVKMGMVKTANGEVTLEYDGDVLEPGAPVFVMSDNGEKVPAPVGEHKLEGGQTLIITEEGVAGEIIPTAQEEPAKEEMAEEAPAPVAEVENEMEDLLNAIKKITVQYNAELKKEIEDLKNELVELKDQPAAKPIKSQPTQVSMSKPATRKGRIIESLKN